MSAFVATPSKRLGVGVEQEYALIMKSRFGTSHARRVAPLAIASLALFAGATTSTPASALDLSGGHKVSVTGDRAAAAAADRGDMPRVQAGNTSGPIDLAASKGTMLTLSQDAASVFVADPTIADVHVPVPRVVYVLGKKPGTTTLYVLDAANHPLVQRTIHITPDVETLRAMVTARFPNAGLKINAGPGSIEVDGNAQDPSQANGIMSLLQSYVGEKVLVVNRLTIDKPLQVQLRVRIAEVDRNVTKQLGIDWQVLGYTGNFLGGLFNGTSTIAGLVAGATTSTTSTTSTNTGSTSSAYSIAGGFSAGRNTIDGVLKALNQEDLLTMLAEPNLVAMSGETASFLAGGEFPIPISQVNGAVTVDYKQYGVKLDFTPTVLTNHRISLKVRPEVSQIDQSSSVKTSTISIPGISVRRADTTVELASGQSFAIAGLLQSNSSNSITQVPGLGSLPIIGKLFSSKSFQSNKSEIVMIVTPYLVNPVDPARLRSPIDSLVRRRSDIEFGFQGQPGNPYDTDEQQPTLSGPAGYVY